jgi:hypothetical protein
MSYCNSSASVGWSSTIKTFRCCPMSILAPLVSPSTSHRGPHCGSVAPTRIDTENTFFSWHFARWLHGGQGLIQQALRILVALPPLGTEGGELRHGGQQPAGAGQSAELPSMRLVYYQPVQWSIRQTGAATRVAYSIACENGCRQKSADHRRALIE